MHSPQTQHCESAVGCNASTCSRSPPLAPCSRSANAGTTSARIVLPAISGAPAVQCRWGGACRWMIAPGETSVRDHLQRRHALDASDTGARCCWAQCGDMCFGDVAGHVLQAHLLPELGVAMHHGERHRNPYHMPLTSSRSASQVPWIYVTERASPHSPAIACYEERTFRSPSYGTAGDRFSSRGSSWSPPKTLYLPENAMDVDDGSRAGPDAVSKHTYTRSSSFSSGTYVSSEEDWFSSAEATSTYLHPSRRTSFATSEDGSHHESAEAQRYRLSVEPDIEPFVREIPARTPSQNPADFPVDALQAALGDFFANQPDPARHIKEGIVVRGTGPRPDHVKEFTASGMEVVFPVLPHDLAAGLSRADVVRVLQDVAIAHNPGLEQFGRSMKCPCRGCETTQMNVFQLLDHLLAHCSPEFRSLQRRIHEEADRYMIISPQIALHPLAPPIQLRSTRSPSVQKTLLFPDEVPPPLLREEAPIPAPALVAEQERIVTCDEPAEPLPLKAPSRCRSRAPKSTRPLARPARKERTVKSMTPDAVAAGASLEGAHVCGTSPAPSTPPQPQIALSTLSMPGRSPKGMRRTRWYQGVPETDKYFKCEWIDAGNAECGAFVKQTDENVSRHMREHFGPTPSPGVAPLEPAPKIVCRWRGCRGRSKAEPPSMAPGNALRHVRTVHVKMERDTCAKCGVTHDRAWALVRHWKKCCKCEMCGVTLEDDVRWDEHVRSCAKVPEAAE